MRRNRMKMNISHIKKIERRLSTRANQIRFPSENSLVSEILGKVLFSIPGSLILPLDKL
jgi:hypothetical protein